MNNKIPPFPDPSAPMVHKDTGILTSVWAAYFEALHRHIAAYSLPEGGAIGEVLTKVTATEGDATWQ